MLGRGLMGPPPVRRSWSLWDGPRCLHTGTVVAPDDRAALQEVLRSTPPVPLDPRRHYRVRVGSAVASAAGDEFVGTAAASNLPQDGAAETAKAERERVEAEARRLLERTLADAINALPPLDPVWIDREKYTEKREQAGLGPIEYDPATRTSRPVQSGNIPPLCPTHNGRHTWRVDRDETRYDPDLDAVVADLRVQCGVCGIPGAARAVEPVLNGQRFPGHTVAHDLIQRACRAARDQLHAHGDLPAPEYGSRDIPGDFVYGPVYGFSGGGGSRCGRGGTVYGGGGGLGGTGSGNGSTSAGASGGGGSGNGSAGGTLTTGGWTLAGTFHGRASGSGYGPDGRPTPLGSNPAP